MTLAPALVAAPVNTSSVEDGRAKPAGVLVEPAEYPLLSGSGALLSGAYWGRSGWLAAAWVLTGGSTSGLPAGTSAGGGTAVFPTGTIVLVTREYGGGAPEASGAGLEGVESPGIFAGGESAPGLCSEGGGTIFTTGWGPPVSVG